MTKEKMKPIYCLGILYDSGAIYIDNTIKTEIQLSGLISQTDRARIVKVKIEENAKRTLPANALFHVWSQQLSGFTGNDVKAQKAALKMDFGYPILRANEELWPKLKQLFAGVNWWKLSYEQKVEMSELIPCTSVMSPKELKLMMDNIKDWAMNTFNIELDNGKRGE